MTLDERTFVEIEFNEHEKETLLEAEQILARLELITKRKILADERTGECIIKKELVDTQNLLLKLACHEFPKWLFEI